LKIYLYGPPASGKSTIGRILAEALDRQFLDLDEVISAQSGMSIPQIFGLEGESGFRRREIAALVQVAGNEVAGGAAVAEAAVAEAAVAAPAGVIALGGGALLNPQARKIAEDSGLVICLQADLETLLERVNNTPDERPLLSADSANQLRDLLSAREEHYRSFTYRIDTAGRLPEETAWQAQLALGIFRVKGMGQPYDVLIEPGGLDRLGPRLRERGLNGPVAVVSDQTVAGLYGERAAASLASAGYTVRLIAIEPGEAHKTISTVQMVWDALIQAGTERGSTVVALGGGVVGDLAGFAAATFLRGVAWVNVPTTLLAMVDSSLGGKTGVDLPQAKNLVGAFYPPRLVLADPQVLASLPPRELGNGLAETSKHGIIADPDLFELCACGRAKVETQLETIVRRGMAVKLKVIEIDPYEKGLRQALNLGHTIGHGVEIASDLRLSHGEAVAIGTVAEARLAEAIGLAEAGLAGQIRAVLERLDLPTEIPANLSRERIIAAMQLDKKRAAGQVRFALPVRVGEVRTGVVVENYQEYL
jgi:shikimate kinase / 3-dehydroquinate synthase